MDINILRSNWSKILDHLKTEHELSDVSFKTWLKPLTVSKVEGSTVTILVPSEKMGLDYVSKKYTLPLKVSIAEITGFDCDVDFILPEDVESDSSSSSKKVRFVNGLNPRYTFSTFVVGNNNKFAHAASLAVAESPGEVYNPLFLYGGVGLGKTHLMHSIAHFISEHRPETNILYVTSEQFTNEVIEAIRNGNNSVISKFREKYRNIDVLLIDDIQFIIGKESTQEEFFHTFNALHAAGKQIILSSDRPPKDMNILEERIRSRFEWGLMADIQSPDYETRIAILQRKQENDGTFVDMEVTEYIATNVKANIRELEGSLNKVIALANLENREINLELAQKALKDIISPESTVVITPDLIIQKVSEFFNIKVEDILGTKRANKIVYPRQIAMFLIRDMTNTNLKSIGEIMGGKDHTTVMHSIKKIEELIDSSDEQKKTIENVKSFLTK